MTSIYITHKSEIVHDEHNITGSGKYDFNWETDIMPEITGAYISKAYISNPNHITWDFEEINVSFDVVKSGDEVYVVYVIYSSGDSFGHSTGNIAVAGVFSNSNDADECVSRVYSNYYRDNRIWVPCIWIF